uniref:Uncharacterized protein n=1 Tax=Cacopsylla melanoneura TaxID=428564 RepID=A0A8D8SZX8_9HEMI
MFSLHDFCFANASSSFVHFDTLSTVVASVVNTTTELLLGKACMRDATAANSPSVVLLNPATSFFELPVLNGEPFEYLVDTSGLSVPEVLIVSCRGLFFRLPTWNTSPVLLLPVGDVAAKAIYLRKWL